MHSFPAQRVASWSSHKRTCLIFHSGSSSNSHFLREVFLRHQKHPTKKNLCLGNCYYTSAVYILQKKMAETRKIYMRPNFNTENTGLETVIAYLHNRAVTYAQYSLKTLQNILQSNKKLLIYGSLRKIMSLLYSILVPPRKIWPTMSTLIIKIFRKRSVHFTKVVITYSVN